jgi:hypothetical protein
MTTDIKFSVTVPAYKAQFLAECIDSILVQTNKILELLSHGFRRHSAPAPEDFAFDAVRAGMKNDGIVIM